MKLPYPPILLVTLITLIAGCQTSMTGSFDPRTWNPARAAEGTIDAVSLGRPRPETMSPLDITIGYVDVSAVERNLVFEPREVETELRSRIPSALLAFPHFGSLRDFAEDADLRMDVQVSKLIWNRNETMITNIFTGDASVSEGERVENSWIECEVDVVFVRPDGARIAAAAGLGVKATQSGVRVVEASAEGSQASRVEDARAAPVSEIDIPDAIRFALEAAIALALPKLEQYSLSQQPASEEL